MFALRMVIENSRWIGPIECNKSS